MNLPSVTQCIKMPDAILHLWKNSLVFLFLGEVKPSSPTGKARTSWTIWRVPRQTASSHKGGLKYFHYVGITCFNKTLLPLSSLMPVLAEKHDWWLTFYYQSPWVQCCYYYLYFSSKIDWRGKKHHQHIWRKKHTHTIISTHTIGDARNFNITK